MVQKELHIGHLRRALALATENAVAGKGGPFGAVIALGSEVITEGVNRVSAELDPTAHAEISAIRQACRKLGRFSLQGCTIYSSCEPCPMCLAAIYWAHLDGLYFAAGREDAAQAGFDDSLLYAQIPLAVAERSLPTTQFLADEGQYPFAEWLKRPDRVRY